MATAGPWEDLPSGFVDKTICATLRELGFPTMTPVQATAIPPLLSSKDVAVDAETGSGKTLSFLVPIAQMLLFSKTTKCLSPSTDVRALVIVPTRELAAQVHSAAKSLFRKLPGSVTPVPLIGGTSSDGGPGPSREHAYDVRLVIGTPGRLNAAIESGALSCRRLEVLILDEADRLLDMGFSVALTSIFMRLPKQRRTGLYSATQTREVEQLARAGLRNPVRVAVKVRAVSKQAAQDDANDVAGGDAHASDPTNRGQRRKIPVTLSSYFVILEHDHKLHHLLRLLSEQSGAKLIVYFLTCACVDYVARLPLSMLAANAAGRKSAASESDDRSAQRFVCLHGRMSQAKRERALQAFSSSANGVLLCTDVAARGLDIPDVDWIVQFDPPQDPDAYVHRVGRTARLGRLGRSVIYLAPHEEAYADFLRVRKCPVEAFTWDHVSESSTTADSPVPKDDEAELQPVVPSTYEDLMASVRDSILADRAVLDASEKAFLSYLRAYKEHRCQYLLPFGKLHVGSVARSFGLLRLPRFQEFKKHRATLDFEPDKSIRIRDIAYKDRGREKHRQQQIREAVNNRDERRQQLRAKSKKRKPKHRVVAPSGSAPVSKPARDTSNTMQSRSKENDDDSDDMNEEARLLRKVKRGKLSHVDFDQQAGYASEVDADATDDGT